jgi:hypothetical protein
MLIFPRDSALKAQLVCELATLKEEIEAKKQRYARLQAANQYKAALTVVLEKEIECLQRSHQSESALPSGLFRTLSAESHETTAAVERVEESIAHLEELGRGLSQGLANTLRNLEIKTQEAWRLVRTHGLIQQELTGRCMLTTLEQKLCGKCVEMIRVRRTVSSTMKESTAPSSRSRMTQTKVCEACRLL